MLIFLTLAIRHRLAAYLFPLNGIRAQDLAIGCQGLERLFYPEYTVPSCLALPDRCTAQYFYHSIAVLYLSDYDSNKQHAGGEKRAFTLLEYPFDYPRGFKLFSCVVPDSHFTFRFNFRSHNQRPVVAKWIMSDLYVPKE